MNNMPEKNMSPFFTAGELASVFGISKQSLLYYDKIHLLSPDFISENGYRHYSIDQYLDLEIIVNLRSLDIPINDIQSYLKNRSREHLDEIFRKKNRVCRDVIRENERILDSLTTITDKLNDERKELRNQVFIRSYPPRYIKVSPLTQKDTGKDRIVLFAKASHTNLHKRCLLEKQQGWVITQDDFFSGHCSNRSAAYFFFLSGPVKNHHFDSVAANKMTPDSAEEADIIHAENKHREFFIRTLPESLYCEMTFDGTFYEKADSISGIIRQQLKKYKLQPVDDIFVLPIQNHWFTKDHNQYVTKLFFQVKS